MSRVYDALKKAEAERAAQGSANEPLRTETPLDPPAHAPSADAANLRPITPAENGGGPARVVGASLYSRASDEFQVLATHIQGFAAEQSKRVLLISSAMSGEGKTFVTLNLGISLARSGCRVLLVDADLRTPALHRAFNLTPLRGLASFLLDKADFESCRYKTGVPGLELVPAGGGSLSSSELFAGPRMRRFIAAAESADPQSYVLIDSPPALAASETQIMARLVAGLLLVVAANKTPRSAVARSLELLKTTSLLGIVMNRFETPYSHRVEHGYYGQYSNQPTREPKS